MQIYTSLNDINITVNQGLVLALGNFDGVHKGHQRLISCAVEKAKAEGLKSGVLTFNNHPLNVISGKTVVKTILSFDEKAQIMENLGVDYLFSIDFNEDVRTLSPQEFVQTLLLDKCKAKALVCGFNYTYGYKAMGNPESLKKQAKALGFEVSVIDEFKIDNVCVSSTYIRSLLSEGKIEDYFNMTGRRYIIDGIVVEGEKNGRKMGFPTANLSLSENMALPANGVYITRTHLGGRIYNSITNIGNKPTIGRFKKNAETHIFDFQGSIYGEHLKVEFLKLLRPERVFADMEALSEEINKNCLQAKEFFLYTDNSLC